MITPLVGRQRERELVTAALGAGAHVLLEGPPGTGKSTLLRAVAADQHVPFVLVEGNAELTPARLAGTFDPALVLEKGYRPDIFLDGPLLRAMRAGALLYIEELNRVPEETVNVLLTVMSEGEIAVPRLGTVAAHPQFRVAAAMNPYDSVGTSRLSAALYDRTCRVALGYQDDAAERRIVAQACASDNGQGGDEALVAEAVEVTRRTRAHPELRSGSSVRGAIDLTRLAVRLAGLRGVPAGDRAAGLDAAITALSGRVRLAEPARRSAEAVIEEIYLAVKDGGGPGE